MTLRKVIRPRADLDIEEQFKYLSRQSRETAIRFLRAVYATIDDLTAAPELGGIWQSPEPRLAGVRVLASTRLQEPPDILSAYERIGRVPSGVARCATCVMRSARVSPMCRTFNRGIVPPAGRTTRTACACLVASGSTGGDHLIVVVLGAGPGDARYTDARALFQWAWQQLALPGNLKGEKRVRTNSNAESL